MKIGLLSDTHGYLDPKVFEHFRDCDEIWHAGDIGDNAITTSLESFKPLKAVYGNIDPPALRNTLPEDVRFQCEGLDIWITHIAGSPPNYNPRIIKSFKERIPDVFICGHSHILRIGRDQKRRNMLFINPGAAGHHGFHHIRTIVRFEITSGDLRNMEVLELGKRGAMSANHTY